MMLNTMHAFKFRGNLHPEKDLSGPKRNNSKRTRLKLTDMRVCPNCGKVWSFYHDGNLLRFRLYTDIPKYGLTKQECPNCEETE